MRTVGRALRRVAIGIWHFVVGDAPEFLLAVVAVVGFALLVHHTRPAEWFGLPVLVLAVLVASLLRQPRRRRGRSTGPSLKSARSPADGSP